MKLKIKDNSIAIEDIYNSLTDEFKNKYNISYKGKYKIVIAADKVIGCTIIFTKDSMYINGSFTTITYQIIFLVLFIILGFLIPILIYFFVFHKKMKLIENEIVQFIQNKYKDFIINTP